MPAINFKTGFVLQQMQQCWCGVSSDSPNPTTMSNTFDLKKTINRIFRYSMLATAISATLAVILGCVVFWFLGPDIARLVAMYAGQTQPDPLSPVFPTGPICCSTMAMVGLIFSKKHQMFPWAAFVFGLLGIGLLANEMYILIDSARYP